MESILWFWAGAGFTWIVLPSIKLFIERRREFTLLKKAGSDPDFAANGIKHLVSVLKQLDADEVKTIVVSVEKYATEDSFVAFGGRAGNISKAIEIVCEQLALRVANIDEQEAD